MNQYETIRGAVSGAIQRLFAEESEELLTPARLEIQLWRLITSFCAALQVIQLYKGDLDYLIENEVSDQFEEVHWIFRQLPETLGEVAAELLCAQSAERVGIDHGKDFCYCGFEDEKKSANDKA